MPTITHDATQARPPETTENFGVVTAATEPDSMSPRRGPPATTRLKTDHTRPRTWSGGTDWEMVVRHTALTLSAAPATQKSRAAAQMLVMSPPAAIARPQTATAPRTILPRNRAVVSQPVVSAATVAPSETAAVRRPGPVAPAWKVSTEDTGQSARGMPKVIAASAIT